MEPPLKKLIHSKRSMVNRPCNPDRWKRNRQKSSRVSGLAYETVKGVVVNEKRFVIVDKCCCLECFKKVDASSQQYLFDEFWKRGKSKQIQDLNLATCLRKMDIKHRRNKNLNGIHRSNQWQYYLRLGSADVRVCRTFVSTLYQITEKRLRIIQQKIVRGDTSFQERRGHHTNRPLKTPANVLPLMKEHLALVSMDESFIIPAKGKENARLDFKKLYTSFSRYYESKTETAVPITHKQYLTLFRKSTDFLSAPSANDYFGYESVELVVLAQETDTQVANGQDSLKIVDGIFDGSQVDHYPMLPDNVLHDADVVQYEIDLDVSLSEIEPLSLRPSLNPNPLVPETELAGPSNHDDHDSSTSANPLADPDQTQVEETSAGKLFHPVESCCVDKCYRKFDTASQRYLYDDFWNRGKSKQIQDLYLASCFTKAVIKTRTVNSVKRRRNKWNFFVKLGTINIPVCLSFLVNLYQISRKRIRVVQTKVLQGETSFPERRGRKNNQRPKLPPKLILLLIKHTSLIPHYESSTTPYCKHFENQDLELKKIYKSFREYYQENMAVAPNIKFRQYEKLFRIHSDITFSASAANQCDFCVSFTASDLPSKEQLIAQTVHEDFCKTFAELKDHLVIEAKQGNCLLIEFDYIPSIFIPRLNVTQEIYKQLPSVHGFNVHNHCDDSSYMFLFNESKTEKNIDSIISFLYATLRPILESKHYQKIILLCNDCLGQSKQIPLVQFCSWMSAIHRVLFQQIFPIQGHSVNICSNNYALFRERNKKRTRLISAKSILKDMVSARPTPFIVSYDSPIVCRWTEALTGFFSAKPKNSDKQKFLLQSYMQLEYFDGKVNVNSTFYNDPPSWSEFNYLLKNAEIGNIILNPAVSPGVLPAKRENVFSLFHLLTAKEIIDFQESFSV